MPPIPANRKFMYPDSSVPYTVYMEPEDPKKLFDEMEKPKELSLEPRSTFLKLGAITTVKGSAYMEYGNTKVMASVEPPREMTSKQTRKNSALGIVTCTVKYAPFATSADATATLPRKESFMSLALKKALEPMICRHEFPNFQLEIKVIILDDDGCALSTAINCCGAALIEGGIPTYDIITASTVCIYKQVDFINPKADVERLLETASDDDGQQGEGATAADVTEEHGMVVVANLAGMGQVTECYQKGYLTMETFSRLYEHTLAVNKRMLETIQYVLVNKVKEHIAQEDVEI